MAHYTNLKKAYSIGFISLFLILISIPGFVMLCSNNTTTLTSEKRVLTEQPEFTTLKSYTQAIETYFNDHFGLRSAIITWSNFLKIHIFYSTPKPELNQFGEEGYLFYTKKDDGIFQSFTHTNLLTEETLKHGYNNQKNFKDSLQQLGIQYVLVFWPNKHSIYPEMLPQSLSKQIRDTLSLTDQVVDYFNLNGFPISDVRSELLSKKKEQQLYYKLDTHWNSFGAFEGYKAFCKQTYSQLGLKAFKKDDFKIDKKQVVTGDLIEMMGVNKTFIFSDSIPEFTLIDSTKLYKRVYPDGISFPTIITENDNAPQQKTLLVFRDSYTTALEQFLSLHYKKVIYIWSNPADFKTVNKFKPDVVISGVVERYIPFILQ